MTTGPSGAALARVAALLADETRATFCLALLDGRGWTANELARHAGVAPSTASEHLSKLVSGGLLTEWRQGRHRYLALAGPHVADLLEDLIERLPPRVETKPPPTLRAATANAAMLRARTCYDHLAGELGVGVTDALTAAGLLDQVNGFALTTEGRTWFVDLGVDLADAGKRPLVRGCLDWTQRRPHLAGIAGARLCQRFFDRAWIERIGSSRAVKVTASGRRELRTLLALDL